MDKFFTVARLKTLLPRNRDTAKLHETLSVILPKYDITTPERVSMFLGQCAHESYELNALTENLNYSVRGLLNIFPRYFNLARAKQYAHKPEKIANRVYANRLGNGNEASGDGWKFRGHGFIQLTGRANHTDFAKWMGMTLEQELTYIKTLQGAVEASCWFWMSRHLNDYADRLDIPGATKKINGSHRGLRERRAYTQKALLLFRNEDDAVPAILKRGMTGPAVHDLQVELNRRGYGVSVDGIFGRGTESAVRQLQRDSHVPETGIVDAKTRLLL